MQHLLTVAAISVFIVLGAITIQSDDARPEHITIDAPSAATTGSLAHSG